MKIILLTNLSSASGQVCNKTKRIMYTVPEESHSILKQQNLFDQLSPNVLHAEISETTTLDYNEQTLFDGTSKIFIIIETYWYYVNTPARQ